MPTPPARGIPRRFRRADRWHLLENLGQAVRTALDRHGPTLQRAAQGVHSRITGEQEANLHSAADDER